MPPGRHISNHTLRHSYARQLLVHGIPINYLSRWLGHSSIQTTLIYLELVPDPSGGPSPGAVKFRVLGGLVPSQDIAEVQTGVMSLIIGEVRFPLTWLCQPSCGPWLWGSIGYSDTPLEG